MRLHGELAEKEMEPAWGSISKACLALYEMRKPERTMLSGLYRLLLLICLRHFQLHAALGTLARLAACYFYCFKFKRNNIF